MAGLKHCPACLKDRPWWAFRGDSSQCVYCDKKDSMKPRENNKGNSMEVGMGTTSTGLKPLRMSTIKYCEACGQPVMLRNMQGHFRSKHSRYVETVDA